MPTSTCSRMKALLGRPGPVLVIAILAPDRKCAAYANIIDTAHFSENGLSQEVCRYGAANRHGTLIAPD